MDDVSSRDKADNRRNQRGFVDRLAWFIMRLWFVVLLLALFGGLVRSWLSYPVSIEDDTSVVIKETDTGNEAGDVVKQPENDPEDSVLFQPRTVAQMLREANEATFVRQDLAAMEQSLVKGLSEQKPQPTVVEPSQEREYGDFPEQEDGSLPDELTILIKEARYAQIEGDIRLAVMKLAQAWELAPEHPVICYYLGLSYEFLRNASKAREFFAKVIAQKEKAGPFYDLATVHLERGFSSPSDYVGDMSFGTILEYREPDVGDGQRVVLTIPILMKDGLNIREEDLTISVQFYDLLNGKTIDRTRAQDSYRWISASTDWSSGEEILEYRYYMPPLTEDELLAYGELKYFGYTAKLYYNGEPMDCRATPPVLLLIEQMRQSKKSYEDFFEDDSLLPPIDSVPVADDGLLPYDGASFPEDDY